MRIASTGNSMLCTASAPVYGTLVLAGVAPVLEVPIGGPFGRYRSLLSTSPMSVSTKRILVNHSGTNRS